MRMFIAAQIPILVHQRLEPIVAEARAHLKAAGSGRAVRWTTPSKLHLTLRFLGETVEAQRATVCSDLQDSVPLHQVFHLSISRLGCFPNQRSPRVLWLGLDGALDQLAALQANTEQVAVHAGFEPERRAFSPHLTIGRIRRGLSNAEQRKLGEAFSNFDTVSQKLLSDQREALTFEVNELVLMQSVLKPDGARYSVLEYFSLRP